MPQDSLWAASARLTGLTIVYGLDVVTDHQDDTLSVIPQWSKRPTGRDGSVTMGLPGYARDHVPEIIAAAYGEFRWGQAKNIPIAARSKLQDVLLDYREGVRG